jgi:hypothetical protein
MQRPTVVELSTIVVMVAMASVLLFWNLDQKYLWQDEAATAVLSVRTMKYGRPLAYDGVNLITIDHFAAEDVSSIDRRTHDPKVAVDYYVQRGDFKADTAWKFQPWGQFFVAGLSMKLFGHTTFAARLPFAIAALLTVVLLYWFVRSHFNSLFMAASASLLLIANAYWILHSRQCRYYSLSCLFLVLTLIAYARWQWNPRRWSAALFVATAWMWFQVDYGTFWPVIAVLFVDALWNQRGPQMWKPLVTGLGLLIAIAPFAYFYELWNRLSVAGGTWRERFDGNLFYLNQYVIPGLVLVVALVFVSRRKSRLPEQERRLVRVGCAIVVVLSLWVTAVAPDSFLRYLVPAMPIGAWLVAWSFVRIIKSKAVCATAIAAQALTPIFSMPLRWLEPGPEWLAPDSLMRTELPIVTAEVFGTRADPNRIVIEWLKANTIASDEILINYEDVPLMFYLPNPIRGGIAAFRVEDDSRAPPQFMVMRRSVSFVHWPVFRRAAERFQWTEISTKAPDIMWGNNPDPMGQVLTSTESLILARRLK